MTKVSIIIPVYNAQNTIIKALISVKEQSFSHYEIIIVNDGSSDSTDEQILSFIKTNGELNITYIKQENRGVASARNVGLRRATGEYIAFLDADDFWLSEKLDIQVKLLDSHKDIFLCGTMFDGFNANIKRLLPTDIVNVYVVTFKNQLVKNYFQPSTVLFRKCVLQTCGYFIEGMTHAEEGLFFYKIVYKYKCVLLNNNLLVYGNGKQLFGHSGLSSDLWKMEKGELYNYWYLSNKNIITKRRYYILITISIMKFLRRLIISKCKIKND